MGTRRIFMMAVAAACVGRRAHAAQVDEADETAVGLGYKHDSTQVDAKKYPQHKPDQVCHDCQFWQGAKTDAWAGCAMFGRKQINAKGWCVAYKKA